MLSSRPIAPPTIPPTAAAMRASASARSVGVRSVASVVVMAPV